jgi:hypothetical protein
LSEVAPLPLRIKPIELPSLAPTIPLEREVAEQGTCNGHPHPEWWTVTALADSEKQAMASMAKHECKRCPVQYKCRDLADYLEADVRGGGLDYQFLAGIWGGEGPKDRANRRNYEKSLREDEG